ncbi:hypothetical protein [Treponema lecithinolyticum]
MEFDKLRVYTAVNADELPIGSKCIFADTIAELKERVQSSAGLVKTELKRVQEDTERYRFVEKTGEMRMFAYLITPPLEPMYKPFESIEQAMEAIKKHGGWVKSKTTEKCFLVNALSSKYFAIIGNEYLESYSFLLDRYTFADDGSPCGELINGDTKKNEF